MLGIGTVYPPHHLGGYEIIWQGVTRRLAAAGHSSRVLVTDYRHPGVPGEAREDPDVHRELDWYWREHEWRSLGPMARLRLEQHNARVFDRHLEQFRPQVICWWPVGGLSLSLIERARDAGVPSVFFVLDPWLSYGRRHDLWLRMWSRLRPLAPLAARATGIPTGVDYAAAGQWVFCSAQMRADTLALSVPGVDGTVLAPGVERSYIEAPREAAATEWHWRLLYVGRVVTQKGIETAVEALPLLPAEASLTIVGEGDDTYRRSLERRAGDLGVSNRLRFMPMQSRERLPDVYRSADVVLHPVMWNEPWGLVPLEAMALGRLVVATGTGGSGDYLRDGENSLLFEAASASGLSDALSRLAADPDLRERLRAGGFATAASHGADEFDDRAAELIVRAATGGDGQSTGER